MKDHFGGRLAGDGNERGSAQTAVSKEAVGTPQGEPESLSKSSDRTKGEAFRRLVSLRL